MPTSKDGINLRKTNLPILWLGIGGTGKLEKIRRAAASDSPTADVMGFSFEVKELQMHDDYKARIIIAPTHLTSCSRPFQRVDPSAPTLHI